MNSRWEKIEEAVALCCEMPVSRRQAWLAEYCDGDADLRSEVESLLSFQPQSERFLEKGVDLYAAKILVEGEPDVAGKQFGNYRILREIGHGGMGAVFLAERTDGEFEQQVALKIVRKTLIDTEARKHFRRERQILASLNHPYIARLLDGGATEDGLPYFVLEYIEGQPLNQYCEEHELSVSQRLELFRKVCAAVQHAHQNLIVHRDLKPSNILITDEGVPKLLDFGIAKLLAQGSNGQGEAATATALVAMTPEYASPEQVRGHHITTASDIYSLGVILYELLTGQRPYKLKGTSPEEMLRVICDTEPTRPSRTHAGGGRRKGQVKENAQTGARNLRLLRGDLDNIVLMALRKEPARRYSSVEQFSEDIRRHLAGLPVIARKDTFAYRASKFVGRNRVAVAAAALVIMAVITGLIVALWQAENARRQRDLAQHERLKANRISQFLSAALAYSDPASAVPGAKNRRDATINGMLDDFAPRIETELADEPDVRASLQRTVGLAYFSQMRLAEAERYLRAALETHLKLYGENQETAVTYAGLASLMEAKGDLAAAENLLRKTVAIYRSQPPVEQAHIKVLASALNTLGDVSWTNGDYNAADAAYTESLALASQMRSGQREFVALAKRGLGLTRYGQGRLDEAATLLREAVAEYRRLPHLRWKLPDALNFLAQTLIWENQSGQKNGLDEALAYLQESEAISLEVWGENNFWYPRSLWLQVYAMCFKGAGECAAAEKTLNKAEELNNRYFPDNKITKGNICDARNVILTRTGRPAEGEMFGRQAVALYQASMNRGTPSITLARLHLAENLMVQKKYAEAEQILLEAYKDASEVQGAGHWRTKEVERRLAALYETWGQQAREINQAPR